MHYSLLEIMIALLVSAALFACSAGEAVDMPRSVHSLDVLSSSPSVKEESPLNKEMLRWLLSSKEGREVSHEELAGFPQYNETWFSLISVGVAQDLPSLSHAASRLASKVLRDAKTHLELSCAALQGTFRFVQAAAAPSIREAASASKCQLPTSAFDVSSSYWRRGVERHDVSAVIAPRKVSAQAEGSSCEQGATFAEAIAYAKERLRTSFSNVLSCEEATWTEEVRTQHLVAIIQMANKEGAAPDYLLVIHDSSSQLLLSLAGSSLGKDATASPTLRLRHIDYTLMVEDMDGNTRSLLVSRSTVASSVASSPSFRLLKSVVLSKGSDSEGGMRRRSSPDTISADGHKNLTVMSYNIWNFNANWEERKVLIANEIMKVEPDIVGVQEIRQRYGTGLSIQPSQLEDLAALLPDYHSWIYQPAMRYTNEQEGVGILARHPILNHSYIDLTFVPGTNDLNQRFSLLPSLSLSLSLSHAHAHIVHF
ncbi:Endonuclease/exonuclease/phosphatase family protein, variant 2 [Balamuthia mandrillaris]